MANDYVGRYGAALRRLTALEGKGPQQFGSPQGAFGAATPQATGAFPPLEQSAEQDQAGPPVSAAQLWKDMPPEYKTQAIKQIEDSGTSLDELYAKHAEAGEVPPIKKEMTKEEKLGYLGEIALRTISNLSRPGTQGISDFADAKLAVDARRGGIEQAELQRARAEQETRRLEARADKKDTTSAAARDEEQRRDRAAKLAESESQRDAIASEGALSRKNALDIAAMQEKSRSAEKQGPVLTDEEGNMFHLNADGTAAPITAEAERDAPGPYARGKAPKEKYRKPLKGVPKQRNNEVDQDTILRGIGERVKILKNDSATMRELKRDLAAGRITSIDDELDRRAQEQVMRELAAVTGKTPAASAAPANPYDQF